MENEIIVGKFRNEKFVCVYIFISYYLLFGSCVFFVLFFFPSLSRAQKNLSEHLTKNIQLFYWTKNSNLHKKKKKVSLKNKNLFDH
jgi:hypothetical protein